MLIDQATLKLSSGKGGDGLVSFRRAKFLPQGGPDGGDGGDGGNLYIQSNKNINTLLNFRNINEIKAENGEAGKSKNMKGRTGEDIIIEVPVGTLIKESGKVILDMDEEKKVLLLEGGRGGSGNIRFKSARRQAPYIALKGKKGLMLEVSLELKLLSDVALVGLPNAGKSTFINSISSAKSKVGNYPFTTLEPKLGVVEHKDNRFVVADIPGLIEGASEGKGLGHSFLKHIERCRLILHLVDLSQDDLIYNYDVINKELDRYSEILRGKKRVVVGTKIDLEESEDKKALIEKVKAEGTEYFEISSFSKEGLNSLLNYLIHNLPNDSPTFVDTETINIIKKEEPAISIVNNNGVLEIKGSIVESVLDKYVMSDDTYEIMMHALNKEGLNRKLTKAGVKPGQEVLLLGRTFEFVE